MTGCDRNIDPSCHVFFIWEISLSQRVGPPSFGCLGATKIGASRLFGHLTCYNWDMSPRDRSVKSSHRAASFLDPRKVSSSIRTIRPVLGYLAASGHDTAAILDSEGVAASLVNEPEARLPHAVVIRLWDAAVRITGDKNLGIHAAEAIQPGDLGAIDYVARTSQTFGAGFTRLARYYAVLNDGAELALEVRRDRAVLGHRLSYASGIPRQISEYVLGCLLVVFRQATGLDWQPLEVRFPHQEPADTSEHRRLFRARLRFGYHCSELVIPRSLVDAPLLRAEPALQFLVEAQVERLLKSLPRGETTADSVRRLLGEELCDGEPRLGRLAAWLHMSDHRTRSANTAAVSFSMWVRSAKG
jgi:hypothetical protein